MTESKCREMIGWARSAHILMRPRKCSKKFCRTFHSHLENSTDRDSFNQEELRARNFSFFCSQSS